jgi:hypothetical protein
MRPNVVIDPAVFRRGTGLQDREPYASRDIMRLFT